MKTRFARAMSSLARLHHCETGAEGLEKLLIGAAIVLPLLGLLVVFRDAISQYMKDTWSAVKSDSGSYDTPTLDP